jgi:glucose/arabinose dehydrogenase
LSDLGREPCVARRFPNAGGRLRIDPRGGNAANHQYGIPADNPFAHQTGALGEIYAYGLPNPFRQSFDLGPDFKGNDLWVGDVGQNDIEEVDRVASGANLGWRIREGAFGFDEAGFDSKGFESDASVFPMRKPAALTDPVANYDHGDGTAVIGGNVYRGSAMPALVGTYVFGDTSRRLNNRHLRIFGIPSSATPEAPATISELRDGPIDGRSPGSARTVSASSTR